MKVIGDLDNICFGVEFGERTRDWTPGHAGKGGPHLEMTVASRGFSQAEAPVWGVS